VTPNARRRPLVTDGAPRVDQLGGKINLLNNQNSGGLQVAAPIRIDVAPTASGCKWRATFDGKVLCTSASPLITSARLLVENGVDPNRTIEMWHQHAEAWALRGHLGAVAATLIDGERKAQRRAKNGPPERLTVPGHRICPATSHGGRNA
jgi:hypothetical protein